MLYHAGRVAPSPLEARAKTQAMIENTADGLSEFEFQKNEEESIKELGLM